ncbi:MAG: hypothetical protein KF841_16810 [Phycisphaerae bacterium]|nr:hypothetical protein [Phycisphaerae bacterium]
MHRFGTMQLTKLAAAAAVVSLAAHHADAQYEIRWSTVDGGGAMYSVNNQFALGGTIGQPDGGPTSALGGKMTGGQFTLVGGFWAMPIPTINCNCPGDMNGDGIKNGNDIQFFVDCFVAGGDCTCADMNQSGGVTTGDISVFVASLLQSDTCP